MRARLAQSDRSSTRMLTVAGPSKTDRAVIRVVSCDKADVAVAHEIVRRYGADYDVATWPNRDEALADLREVRSRGEHIALVIAVQSAAEDGVGLLAVVLAW